MPAWKTQIDGGSITRLTDDLTVSLVTGVCILARAVVSNYLLDVELDFDSQYGPVWIYIVYVIGRDEARRSQRSTLLWSATIVIATLAILVVYAI